MIKHKWESVEVKDSLRYVFKASYVCKVCGCERDQSYQGDYIYCKYGITMSRPDCDDPAPDFTHAMGHFN